MWLTLDELVRLGLDPGHYKTTSKILRVMVAEDTSSPTHGMYVFTDLKTGKPVLFFENCETDQRALVEMCCNLKEVDQHMDVGILMVEELLEILEMHVTAT